MSAALARGDLLGRAGLVVAASVATAMSAPVLVRLVLSVLAVGGVIDLGVRTHHEGGREATAVVTGASLVVVLALGYVLNLLPLGLGPLGWALGLGLAGLVAIALLGRRPARARPRLRQVVRADGLWYFGAAVLVAAGLLTAVSVTRVAEQSPVQMFAKRTANGTVEVVLTTAEDAGPYDLWLEDGRTERVLRSAVSLTAGHRLALPLARLGDRQMRIALRDQGSPDDLLYVIVNPG